MPSIIVEIKMVFTHKNAHKKGKKCELLDA
jgi:hypothetical protein